ncbi:NIPSNAP family protein [Kitasatospora sp. GP82]|uniref:NIPSNAP family protein n=1 Tax=Kitasatospora sp. GP82 TaxID=3035089 RepID=UPI002474B3EF|nr:NIPSNAP family protein [Kitasatospora sp. GP82]MDH6125615.1 hypothetical protein [Kitasatospora sp. GP82]
MPSSTPPPEITRAARTVRTGRHGIRPVVAECETGVEDRRYRTRPGRRDEWVRCVEEVVIPFQTSKGMSVTASFIEEEDQDGCVWIRRFDDEAQRQELYAAVYESDRWRGEISPVVQDLPIAEKSVVTRAVPTPRSVLR